MAPERSADLGHRATFAQEQLPVVERPHGLSTDESVKKLLASIRQEGVRLTLSNT
jgi:hypothetical protein